MATCCGIKFSGNTISLMVLIVLFLTISTAQLVASYAAHSLALRADCVSMYVDALSYTGNLVAELHRNDKFKPVIVLAFSGVSLALLVAFTAMFFIEALTVLTASADDDGGDDVNGWIVLVFALFGLLFDAVGLVVYRIYGGSASDPRDSLVRVSDVVPAPDDVVGDLAARTDINMCSALLHVLSDLMRSTTTLIEAVVILCVSGVNSSKADALATTVVCTLIVPGCLGGMIMWFKSLRNYLRNSDKTLLDEDQLDPVNVKVARDGLV